MQRAVRMELEPSEANKDEIARILAYYVTGGDPAGYLERIRQKYESAESEEK